MRVIAGMGFSSGLPYLLTAGTLTYWLSTLGFSLASIGLLSLVGLPYSLKFFWAPWVDRMWLPWIGPRLGRRRSWALVSQLGIVVTLLLLSQSDPRQDLWTTAVCLTLLAFCSATQDIAVDAYRIEILSEPEQGLGAALTQAGYRAGLLVGGAGAIALSDSIPWSTIFQLLAVLVGVGTMSVAFAREPDSHPDTSVSLSIRQLWLGPLRSFAERPSWPLILVFVLLYKGGDVISSVMANPFFYDLGFTGKEISGVAKLWGVVATLLGVFAGGLGVARLGVLRALIVGGVLQASTNLLYSWQASVGPDLQVLVVVIGCDSFTGGFGSAAFVAYLSGLSRGAWSGTQYALLTSFMSMGRHLLGSGSGWLAAYLGWSAFFVWTALLAVPGLLLLSLIGRRMQEARA